MNNLDRKAAMQLILHDPSEKRTRSEGFRNKNKDTGLCYYPLLCAATSMTILSDNNQWRTLQRRTAAL